MSGTLVIDCFPESVERYRANHAIVAVDVIRATTTATTALAAGRRVFPAATSDEALMIAAALRNPLLVGELGGNTPYGFDMTNSPAQIARRMDVERPVVLVSSSGTQLIVAGGGSEGVYVACLRNYSAVARCLAGRHGRIAIIGAGTRGAFRREDQIGCALVAEQLIARGYVPENQETADYVGVWREPALETIRGGRSAEYLRRSGQEEDLDFILSHVDDLDIVPCLFEGELVDALPQPAPVFREAAFRTRTL